MDLTFGLLAADTMGVNLFNAIATGDVGLPAFLSVLVGMLVVPLRWLGTSVPSSGSMRSGTMVVSERQRHALHEWARTAANEEVAETLMELLPPVGWADVATKRDVDHLEERLRTSFQAELHGQLRQHTYWIMTSVWAAVGVAVGLSQAL